MKISKVFIILAILIVVLVSFVIWASPNGGDRVEITASFYPPATFSEAIVGDLMRVNTITPPGADPHSFEPTPRDIARVLGSDIFIFYGAGQDPWAERIAQEARDSGVTVIEMTEHFELAEGDGHDHHDDHGHEHGHDHDEHHDDHEHDEHHNGNHHDDHHEDSHEHDHNGEHGHDDDHHDEHGHDHDHDHGHDHSHEYDPHIWLDPMLAIKQVEIIRDAVISVDPENSEIYLQNAENYISELNAIHGEYEEGLAQCEIRTIVVAHAAFHYLAERYGLEMVAIGGISPEIEPSLSKIREITEIARNQNIEHIFFETLISPRVSETIANEVGAGTLVLDPIEGLSREQIASGEDYVSIMRNNLENLRTALRCQ